MILDLREHGGLDVEALGPASDTPTLQLGPLALAALDHLHDLVKLLLVNLGRNTSVSMGWWGVSVVSLRSVEGQTPAARATSVGPWGPLAPCAWRAPR